MRIHYYMHYLPGEGSVGSQQPISLAQALADRGHEVTALSADYNLDNGLPEKALDRATEGGGRLCLLRLSSPRGGRGSNLQRLRAYIGFAIKARAVGGRLPRPDVVVGSIQPLFTGMAALGVARKAHCPFVLEVRDLWPDALVVKKAIPPLAAAPLAFLTHRLYHAADRIVSITPGIKTELVKKGLDSSRIDVFPNGFNPRLFTVSADARRTVRSRYGWGDDFVALYTGSFTTVTATEVFVQAAARLKDLQGFRMELFGAGPSHGAVRRMAEALGADNVFFREPIPKREVPDLLAAADAALMALFPTPLAHIYFENKFMDYLGAGCPVFGSMEGEQARILAAIGAGACVPPHDSEGLADLLRRAASGSMDLAEMGRNGARFVRERLLLPDILERYAAVVEAAAAGRLTELPAWEPTAL
jgi:glycosyltransferase involved in cell wall biosynthesis